QVVVSPAQSGKKLQDGPPVPLAEQIAALPSPTYLSSPSAPLFLCLLSQFSPFRRKAANSGHHQGLSACCRPCHRRNKDARAFREGGGEHHERHHGHHRRQSPQQEIRQVRRGLCLRASTEAVRRQEECSPRSGRWKVRRCAAVEKQENLLERPRRGHRRLDLLRVAWLPLPHHRELHARTWHGRAVRLVQLRRRVQRVTFERASCRAIRGAVREHRRGGRQAGEQGPGCPSGHLLWKKLEAVSRGDRRVLRGRGHWELVQLPNRHLHRVCVCAHTARALREVPGPGG
ncbi:hypothetical protein EJB05_14610, partial [Eragrostis curvula]